MAPFLLFIILVTWFADTASYRLAARLSLIIFLTKFDRAGFNLVFVCSHTFTAFTKWHTKAWNNQVILPFSAIFQRIT